MLLFAVLDHGEEVFEIPGDVLFIVLLAAIADGGFAIAASAGPEPVDQAGVGDAELHKVIEIGVFPEEHFVSLLLIIFLHASHYKPSLCGYELVPTGQHFLYLLDFLLYIAFNFLSIIYRPPF